jgi:hypothetical protein
VYAPTCDAIDAAILLALPLQVYAAGAASTCVEKTECFPVQV